MVSKLARLSAKPVGSKRAAAGGADEEASAIFGVRIPAEYRDWHKRTAFDGPGRTVIDEPFPETRELVACFWLSEVKDMDEAVAWVKRCPNPMPGPSEVEILPLYEMADFQ